MPLYLGAEQIIRSNLEMLRDGQRPPFCAIGYLTDVQFDTLNQSRRLLNLHALQENELLFMGRHLFHSRSADGYTIDDMVDQITSALAPSAVVSITGQWSRIENLTPRADRYGNFVCDRAVLEMTAKRPKAEVYSVMPKGDRNKPETKKPA